MLVAYRVSVDLIISLLPRPFLFQIHHRAESGLQSVAYKQLKVLTFGVMLGVLLATAVFQPSISADEARTGTCTKLISMSSSGEVGEVWVFVTPKCKSGTNANTSLFLVLCFKNSHS